MNRSINISFVALGSGLVFGVGLALSRMTDPNKIISFLNLAGHWDPSLLLVMASALTVATIGFRVAVSQTPAFDAEFHLPKASSIDRRLIFGSAIFGIGWGLGGFCPGPAVAALGSGAINVVAFIIALIVGGWVANKVL